MSFASGSISYRRYQVSGPHPEAVDKEVIAALGKHAFGAGGKTSADGLEVGWIAPTHLFDTDIAAEKVSVGRFLHVAMRLDRLNPPPAVVRSYYQMEETAARQGAGKLKLSPEERRRAKETAQARADQEARRGLFRRISAHSVVFDLENHAVYVGSLGNTVHDKLRILFANTFGATLVPMDVAELASQLTEQTGRHRSMEDAVPTHLIEPPTGSGNGHGSVDAADRSFLGREFLTWLWHEVETNGGVVPVASNGRHALPGEVAVALDRVMQLDCDFRLSGRDIVYTDDPGTAPEAQAALSIGKQPCRTGLTLGITAEQYRLVLDATRWHATGLTLPTSDEPDPGVRLEERLLQMTRCAAVLDGLLGSFLAVRFGRNYRTKLGQLRRWALNGPNGRRRLAKTSAEQAPLSVVR